MPSDTHATDQLPEARAALGAWFDVHQRDLPWRRERSLYRTVVSEFMLQQTQVVTMLPYFERWLDVFPDFEALAQADEDAVLKLWEGLGYYSRARNLHKLARTIASQGTPSTLEGWRKMPGVGPYTAAAICSMALNLPAAVVDGNVVRVLSRVYGIDQEFDSGIAAIKRIQPIAERFLDSSNPARHNEALMELGATICTKQRPSCLLCPLRSCCRAAAMSAQERIPRIRRRATEAVTLQRGWFLHQGSLLLAKNPASAQRLANCYELPLLSSLPVSPAVSSTPLAIKTRAISNQRIREEIYSLGSIGGLEISNESASAITLHWVPRDKLDSIRLSGPHKKWITELLRES